MAATLKFIPGSTIRWGAKRFVVVDYAGMDAIIAREVGKRKLERIPVRVADPDRTPGDRTAWTPDLVSIPEEAWEGAVKRFKSLKPLLEMDRTKRTFEKVQKVADAVGKHPATIYRWIEAYERSERVSVFLRKGRSDRGKNRLSNKVNAIIETAIKKIYLTAEQARCRGGHRRSQAAVLQKQDQEQTCIPTLFGIESRLFRTASNWKNARAGRRRLKDTSPSRATFPALTIR